MKNKRTKANDHVPFVFVNPLVPNQIRSSRKGFGAPERIKYTREWSDSWVVIFMHEFEDIHSYMRIKGIV